MTDCFLHGPYEGDKCPVDHNWKKTYIGDSVYLDRDGYGRIVLTTENGMGPSNTIVLEPEVLENLLRVIEKKV